MKTEFSSPVALVLIWTASLTMLFASPNTQPSGNPQTDAEVTLSAITSTSSDNGGMHTRADIDLPSVRYGSHIDLNQPSVTLEPVDARSITLNPNQIGVNRSVEVSPNTRAQKFVNPDGSQLIVLITKSSGASGLGVHFRNFALAEGEEVYVYGAATDSIVFGPFTNKGPWGSGEFWSGTVDRDTVVIEFYKRSGENGQGFEVFEVSHILTGLDSGPWFNEPDVLNCHVDASCYGDPQKNATGRIMFNNNGAYVCTGTLLNNVTQDRTPFFLTANHCVNSQAVAQTVEVYWFYQTTSCNSYILRDWVHSPPGANLLATQSANDFSLLRLLNSPPAGALFSGWTSAIQPINTNVFGLLHPGPYIPPSLFSYLRRATGTIVSTNAVCSDTGLVNGYETGWTFGTTEPGASGSGLFTSNGHYLVGVDSCGMGVCDTRYTWYSKFANFYPQVRQYINSAAPSPPVANPATLVASNSFTANWRSVLGATGYRLDLATNNSFTNYVAGYQNLNVGNALGRSVTGLSPSTTYFYRVRAYHENFTSGNSNVVTVTTLTPTGLPIAITDGADIFDYSIDLNGRVNPHGLSTTVYFEYGRTINYGSRTGHYTRTGNTYQHVSGILFNPSRHTTYHYRTVASNSSGTRYGADRTFTSR